ncbi:MAG: Rrf2 family transcriptional regulator [Candidatus Omnitrophica bacterium]|nr:Rrf2 family transcriptional regulator [Candidatus Omnitrophota bacterium]MCM8800335.1 Rrf2 family transcriptional regulator [Candidatus Omnitrophota bacterium]
MRLITRDTDYAIRTLCLMADRPKKVFSVSELTKKLNIPRPFLRKILQILHKNKILEAFKGKGGGFLLKKSIDKIYLLDLMNIFQGRFSLNRCLFKRKPCPRIDTCKLRKRIKKMERYLLDELKKISLGSLLN